MSPRRCRAPGCGRFISANQVTCQHHRPPDEDNDDFEPEIRAIRQILDETLKYVRDAEVRAKLIPRIVSVSIQASKARHQFGSQAGGELTTLITAVLEEMDDG